MDQQQKMYCLDSIWQWSTNSTHLKWIYKRVNPSVSTSLDYLEHHVIWNQMSHWFVFALVLTDRITNDKHCKDVRFAKRLLCTWGLYHKASALAMTHCVSLSVASCKDRSSCSLSHSLPHSLTSLDSVPFLSLPFPPNGFGVIDCNKFGKLKHGWKCTGNDLLPSPCLCYSR